MTKSPSRFAHGLPTAAATLAAVGTIAHLEQHAHAGIAVQALSGMTANSYTINATAPGRPGASSTTLSLSSSDNASYDSSFVVGATTGDEVNGGNWDLSAGAADYQAIFSPGTPHNLVGVEMTTITTGAPDFAVGDTISATFELVFTETQRFLGLTTPSSPVTISSATLARSGGATADLTTTSTNTAFTAGTYTLTLSGSINTNDASVANIFVGFTLDAVPGGGVAVAAGGLFGISGRRRRER